MEMKIKMKKKLFKINLICKNKQKLHLNKVKIKNQTKKFKKIKRYIDNKRKSKKVINS